METKAGEGAPRVEASEEANGSAPKAADADKNTLSAENAKAPDKGGRGSAPAAVSSQIDDLVATVRRLEAFAADEAKRVSGKLVPQIESKAKQNIWVSLLLALGFGLILGIWLTGGRRRD